jgi:hypothetical protein
VTTLTAEDQPSPSAPDQTALPCSAGSRNVGETLSGTAPVAQCWVIIEQAGPWGRDAPLNSHLDPLIGSKLIERTAGTGTRVLLARHPDRLERSADTTTHNVWIAHTAPGDTRMRHGVTTDLSAIANWDFAAMAQGTLPPFGTAVVEPVLFICTHSGRDHCCAVHGRALMNEVLESLDPSERASVWESSHIGGHRFAPTALSLPSGTVFGRLQAEDVARIRTDDRSQLTRTENNRGRSAFPAPMQVAEHSVRLAAGVIERDVLDVLWVRDGRAVPIRAGAVVTSAQTLLVEVRHRDGRSWHVTVRNEELAGLRAESCGADLLPAYVWRTVDVREYRNWT